MRVCSACKASSHEWAGLLLAAGPQPGRVDVHREPVERRGLHAAGVRQSDAGHAAKNSGGANLCSDKTGRVLIINKSEKVKALKNKAKDKELSAKDKKELTAEEKECKSKRKLVQEKLIKFATRIPAFMYLTDFRENTLQDMITRLEPELSLAVTGLTVKDFHLLVRLKVFSTEHMNQAVFAFRRYEDASLRYTGIESHPGLTHVGLYDTVVARE
jgi:hypothetical protein